MTRSEKNKFFETMNEFKIDEDSHTKALNITNARKAIVTRMITP